MQSTFLYMLASLAAMSIGVDASAVSKDFRNSTVAIPTSTSFRGNSTTISENPTSISFTQPISITSTATVTTSTSFPDGQVFVCYPANQAVFTIVTSVVFSTVLPSSIGTSYFPTATVTGTVFSSSLSSASSFPTGTVFPSSLSEASSFPTGTVFPSSLSEASSFPTGTAFSNSSGTTGFATVTGSDAFPNGTAAFTTVTGSDAFPTGTANATGTFSY